VQGGRLRLLARDADGTAARGRTCRLLLQKAGVVLRQGNAKAVQAAEQRPQGNTIRWVVSISALKCRGGAAQWVNADAALPLAAPHRWQPSWPYCHSLPVTHDHPFFIAHDLLDPPPRLEAV
jgi:hypothetical protein